MMPKRRVLTIALAAGVLVLCSAAPSRAQAGTGVVLQAAAIYLRPDATRVPMRTAAINTVLRVKAIEGEWLHVEFQDPQYGRREGYVLAKNVRVSAAELEPMDLSVRDSPRPEPPLAPTPVAQPDVQFKPVPTDVVGGRSQTRRGFWFNAGMGFGSLGCQDCELRENGLSGGISMGRTIGSRVLLGIGTAGWARTIDDETVSIGILDVRVRVYPTRTTGFFVTGGAGLGSATIFDETEFGVGVLLGVGWDIRVGRNVSLTPFWNGFAVSNSSGDANVGQLGIGVTIH